MVGGSNPSAPATSSEMTNSIMNKLSLTQYQLLQNLNIQCLDFRTEIFPMHADSDANSDVQLLVSNIPSVNDGSNCTEELTEMNQVSVITPLLVQTASSSPISGLLLDIQQVLPEGLNLQILQDVTLPTIFAIDGQNFVIRDHSVLQHSQTKRQLWQWISQFLV